MFMRNYRVWNKSQTCEYEKVATLCKRCTRFLHFTTKQNQSQDALRSAPLINLLTAALRSIYSSFRILMILAHSSSLIYLHYLQHQYESLQYNNWLMIYQSFTCYFYLNSDCYNKYFTKCWQLLYRPQSHNVRKMYPFCSELIIKPQCLLMADWF